MPISRRAFTQHSLLTATAMSAPTSHAAQYGIDAAEQHLGSTALMQSGHSRIVQLVNDITLKVASNTQAAVLIHDWVRDEIAFGIPSGFYETTATETLDAKVGYCNTKVTLFQALLRARSIPTRLRMMDLSAQVLRGLFDSGTSYVDHAITEVFLEERWVKVDSYVVDSRLSSAARKKLSASQDKAGFGVHINGKSQWDGISDNFIQYMNDGLIKDYVLKDHGIFADVADFYRKVPQARNRKTLVNSLAIRFGHNYINQQIQKVRESA